MAGLTRPGEVPSSDDFLMALKILHRCPAEVDGAAWLAAQVMPMYGMVRPINQMPPIVAQFYNGPVDHMEGIF